MSEQSSAMMHLSSSLARAIRAGVAAAAPALLGLLPACMPAEDVPADWSRAAGRGRDVYRAWCASCHHPSEPWRDGAQGPAVAGASRALLEAKVLRGEYPPGYEPKRRGGTMPIQAHLKDRLGDLTEYLAVVAAAGPSVEPK
ncbi:MAG: cytochrome c [Planctomycetota bacterium]